MGPGDNIFSWVAVIAVVLAAMVSSLLLLRSLVHLLAAGIRRLRGRPMRFQWLVALPLLLLFATTAAAFAAESIARRLYPTSGYLEANPSANYVVTAQVSAAGAVLVLVALFVLPLLVALLRARLAIGASHRPGARWLRTIVLLLALPGAMALTTSMLEMLDTRWDGTRFRSFNEQEYFSFRPAARCGRMLQSIGLREPVRDRPATDLGYVAEYWLDTTVNNLAFGLSEITGCSISRVELNRDDLRLVALNLFYHLAVLSSLAVIVFSALGRRRGIRALAA